MKLGKFNYLSCVLLAFASCTQIDYKDAAVLELDSASITVDADAAFAGDPFGETDATVYDTLNVTYSRSWSVSVQTEDGQSWVTPLCDERMNLSGTLQTYQLVLKFERNFAQEDRHATLTFHSTDISETAQVEITQKAHTPSLTLSDNKITSVPAISASCHVIIRSNTDWTVNVDEMASTVIPEIDIKSGSDTKAIFLTFPDNPDDGTAKAAILNIKGKGCDPQTLKIIQHQGEYAWYIDGEVGGELNPMAENVHIPLRSNGAWKAEISDCTFANARLEPSEGKGTLTGLTFYADHGFDPEVLEKKATVTIKREGEEDLVVSFTQRGSIHLNFGHFNPNYTSTSSPYTKVDAKAIFSSPSTFDTSYKHKTYAGIVTDCVMKQGKYVFTMYGADHGFWFSASGQLWLVGKSRHDYILFPAVEGYRLSKMYYEASCRCAVPYTIRTADGKAIIKGGEIQETLSSTPPSQEYQDLHIHDFPETLPGERYRINLEENGSQISVKDLCLIYDKVE